ncbi:hypothetical protein [Virgibacillus ihumii]|uniref:hypothetical protein n=1 Tax=Virgibacillus ihumii TaxID=2686091 RepID=UPI00157C4059|nr:hypothetical protein [Virgibacillus ihumii]
MSESTQNHSFQNEGATKKPAMKRRKKPAKPEGFKEYESLAKSIIEANGRSYYEWLHQRHQEIILEVSVKNQKQVTKALTNKGE